MTKKALEERIRMMNEMIDRMMVENRIQDEKRKHEKTRRVTEGKRTRRNARPN